MRGCCKFCGKPTTGMFCNDECFVMHSDMLAECENNLTPQEQAELEDLDLVEQFICEVSG